MDKGTRYAYAMEYAPRQGIFYGGTGASGSAPVYDATSGYYIDPSTHQPIDIEHNGSYLNANGNYIDTDPATLGTEINPETGMVIDPATGLDTTTLGVPQQMAGFSSYRMSMDGEHYIGSTEVITIAGYNGAEYNITRMYGPWGDFLWTEGTSYPGLSNISRCGDIWDDNCLAGPANCTCSGGSTALSCGQAGATSANCLCSAADDSCREDNTCPAGSSGLVTGDCNPCCVSTTTCTVTAIKPHI
jgi:hypothetical protein